MTFDSSRTVSENCIEKTRNCLSYEAIFKDINTMDLENFLTTYPNAPLAVNSMALFRTLPESDPLFTQAHTESPWKDQGDLVFICSEGETVRAHRILLNAILPVFVTDLFKIQALVTNSSDFPSPQLPIFILGIDASCVKTFLALLNEKKALMTGREILQLKKLIEVLGIRELSISIEQTYVTVTNLNTEDAVSSNNDEQLTMRSTTTNLKEKTKKREPIGDEVRKSALDALKSGDTVTKIAAQFNLNPKTVSRWKNDYKRKAEKIQPKIDKILPYPNSEPMDISPVKLLSNETQLLNTKRVITDVGVEEKIIQLARN